MKGDRFWKIMLAVLLLALCVSICVAGLLLAGIRSGRILFGDGYWPFFQNSGCLILFCS